MNPEAYLQMARMERQHWWFAGRRIIIASLLARLKLPGDCNILEVGSGTGGNLEMLMNFGKVSAVEKNSWAVQFTNHRFGTKLRMLQGDFMHTRFANERFDLICAFDVLEHLPDDISALRHMRKLLADNGRIILTVPAYHWLWSSHDESLHHYRRYCRNDLIKMCSQVALEPEILSYFNFLLFPFAMLFRLIDKILYRDLSDKIGNVGGVVNRILREIFAAERLILRRFGLPFGLSLVAVLRKR